MKKFFGRTLFILLVILMVFGTTTVLGYAGGDGPDAKEGVFHYCAYDGEAEIWYVDSSASGVITIPAMLGGYPVTTIYSSLLDLCDNVTGFAVDENNAYFSVDSYGVLFNKNKTKLVQYPTANSRTKYEIPSTVEAINSTAFKGCKSLISIAVNPANKYYSSDSYGVLFDINKTELIQYPLARTGENYAVPQTVKKIGVYSFYDCDSLVHVEISEGVETIGSYAFSECDNLSTLPIPSTVTSLGNIGNCKSLTKITVAARNQNYSSDSYGVLFNKDKTTLIQYPVGSKRTSYTIPNTVTKVASYSFENCSNLMYVDIPTSVVELSFDAFKNCDGLQYIDIPEGVEDIYSAFADCDSLQYAYISDTVSFIRPGTFQSCNNLSAIWVDSGNPYYSSDSCGALYNKRMTELKEFPAGSTITNYTVPANIAQYAFYDCDNLRQVTIGSGATYINRYAFNECDKLEKVTIPSTLNSIYGGTFENCVSLKEIKVASDNSSFTDVNGVLFNKNKTEIITYPAGKTDTRYEMPQSVKSIYYSAFQNCDSLKEVILSDKMSYISGTAFSLCDNLEIIEIPLGITTIYEDAFYGCNKLKDVYYAGSRAEWQNISILEGNDCLVNAKFHFKDDECSFLDWTLDCNQKFNNGYLTIDEGTRLQYECSVKYNLCDDAYVSRSSDDSPYWVSYEIYDENGESICLSGAIAINGFDTDPIVSGVEYKCVLDIATDKLVAGKYRIVFYVPGIDCDFHNEHYIYESEIRVEVVDAECCGFDFDTENITYEMYNGYLMVPKSGCITNDITLIFDVCPYGCVESHSDGAVYLSYSLHELSSKDIRISGFGIVNSDNLENIESGKEYRMSFDIGLETIEIGEYELIFSYPEIGCELHGYYESAETSMKIKIVENDTLIFDANGGSGAPQAMTDAVYYTIPSTIPIREGYVFEGWSLSGNNSEIFKSGDEYGVFRGTTLYAVWKLNPEFVPQPTTSEISYGDSIVLHADVVEIPEGGYILWTASNGNFDMEVSADGKTCTITPSKSGDTTFTATIYDAEGNEICKDEQTMTSKAGFFDKIIAFFKKLFGLTKTIPESIKVIY